MVDKVKLWTVHLTEGDIRTTMRALDYVIERAETADAVRALIDTLCRRECAVQWKRIRAELYSIVGDE